MLKQADNNDLQEKLRALEALFSQKLPDRLSELDAALSRYLGDTANKEHLVALHRSLHTLAGAAGTFGFVELGQRARQLEHDLNILIAANATLELGIAKLADEVREFLRWAQTIPKGAARDAGSQRHVTARRAVEPPAATAIYLVSSDALLAKDIALQLEYFGYEVIIVSQCGQLEASICARPPAVIVVDAGSGSGSGASACAAEIAQIRQTAGQRVPAIVLSNRGNFKARLAAVSAGADGYFTKPVDVVALSDRLDALTARREILPYRILIVDDDVAAAEYYAEVLRGAGMDVRILHKVSDILRVLREYRPELVLMDVYMPEYSGIELAKLIRQDNTYLDVPIVFLSSENDLAKQLNAIESGGDDFITKPIEAVHLVSSISSRAERYRALRGLIMRDSLTGLLNHSAIKEQLARELARAERTGSPLALAMLDLDCFKRINDTYGHPVGDQVIRALSRLLQQRLRRVDIVGRYGGEEFVVILPGASAAAALNVIDQVRQAFSKVRHHADEGEFTVTFSAGVADAEKCQAADVLFNSADAALYRAKHQGRNRVEIG